MKVLCELSGTDEEMKSRGGSAVFLMTLEIPANLCRRCLELGKAIKILSVLIEEMGIVQGPCLSPKMIHLQNGRG